jgi:hypothetical protein
LTVPVEPPAPDEAELSAFGPGYGECILVHLGLGEWMMVDSCVRRGNQPALEYLRSMGVDLSRSVRLVVATHWHDDHVRGISTAVDECTGAKFVSSAALKVDEVVAGFGQQQPGRFGKVTSGVDELATVLKHLERAGDRDRLRFAIANEVMYRRTGDVPCHVEALAPGHPAMQRAYDQLARELKAAMDNVTPRRVSKPERNDAAVVLWIEVANATILLGADLQETDEVETGWTAVIGCRPDPQRRSEVFKVPHHGSPNAYQPLVWRTLLIDEPEAVICPHHRGSTELPSEQDLELLCQQANVHVTAEPRRPTPSIRHGRPSRPAIPVFGRVTLRRRPGDVCDWAVSYEPPARFACPDKQAMPHGTPTP